MPKNNTEAPQKDIVSFDQALELCSLGFNEATFCMYEIENKQLCLCYLDEDGLYMPEKDFHAPTKSQVFRWFREKYEAYSTISTELEEGLYYRFFIQGNEPFVFFSGIFYTYEEVESSCIDKLIELSKQQTHA